MDTKRLQAIAEAHQVKRLELFGSAAKGKTTPGDYDFLVEFQPMELLEHGRKYFALLESLENTLNSKVDLIEIEAVTNPYFLRAIADERVTIYATRG